MQVLLDSTPLSDMNSGRGVGTYTRELLKALRELPPKEDIQLLASHEMDKESLAKAQPEIIHYPFFDLFFNTLKVGKTPTIVTIHDVTPLVFPKEYAPGIKGQFRFSLQQRALQSVSAVITDSEHSKKDIVKYLGVSAHTIFVVPLAASAELQPQNEYFSQKYTAEMNLPSKYILYIGDINYNKNLPTLLLALTQLQEDVHLCVVSQTFKNTDIPEGKAIWNSIQANDLKSRVHVLNVPKDQPDTLASVITRARCLVQPSLYEGFGLPVLEAMQVGTVVVSSNAASLPEVAGDAAIIVEPTIAGLVEGLEAALSLRGDDRDAVIELGKRHAAQFSWAQTAKLTAQVYKHVFAQAHA